MFKLNKHIWERLCSTYRLIHIEEGDTQELIYQKYSSLLHLRHDLLHTFVAELLQTEAKLGVTSPIGQIFKELKKNTHYTPDIVVFKNGRVLICDVAIGVNPEFERGRKLIKYNNMVEELRTYYPTVNLVIISASLDLANLNTELGQLTTLGYMLTDYSRENFLGVFSSLQVHMARISPHVSPEYFKKLEVSNFRTELRSTQDYMSVKQDNPLEQLRNHNYLNDEQCKSAFIEMYNNPKVKEKLRDCKHTISKFEEAFYELEGLEPGIYAPPKPTLHFLYVPHFDIPFSQAKLQRQDQYNSYNLLQFVLSYNHRDAKFLLLTEIFTGLKTICEDPREKLIFETGFYTGTYEGDKALKESLKQNNSDFTSIRQSSGQHKKRPPYCERAHQIRIGAVGEEPTEFKNKSGTQFFRHHPEGRHYGKPNTCQPDSERHMEDFLRIITKRPSKILPLDPMVSLPIGKDAAPLEQLKERFREEYKKFYKMISSTHIHLISYHTMLAADQAIHYASLNTKDGSYYIVNTGLPNVIHIFSGGTLSRGKDIGQPFFTVAVTDDIRWANNVWGQHSVYTVKFRGKPIHIIITGWRRLQNHKLMLLRDQYYSCQSTGFDTYQRNIAVNTECSFDDYLLFVYGFRCVVAMCTSQRVSEFLMDVRYVVMACYSDYTNVCALIKDKFGPHYPNVFCRWIIKQLSKKIYPISEAYRDSDSLKKNMPIFLGEKRLSSSLGGSIEMPSLWTDYVLNGVQDLFDELFVYVHTGKEPSSIFYESVKSITTIQKFENEYKKLDNSHKNGIHTVDSFTELILSGRLVGCWADFINVSARDLANKIKSVKLKAKLDTVVHNEVLSDIVSTKACITEYKLRSKDTVSNSAKDRKKKLRKEKEEKRLEQLKVYLLGSGGQLEPFNHEAMELFGLHNETVIDPYSKTNRAKVHDMCLDFILNNEGDSETVLSVANWNMFNNNARVTADICIKAQYGAKREFYVVNFGAKCMIRVYENIFKAIAKNVPQEMISVPGDQKMINMYNNVNEVLKARKTTEGETFYVNGDCTKWSAAETMASFWALTNGFSEIITPEMKEYCFACLRAWSDKEINVPKEILEGIKFLGEKTSYLRDGQVIKSHQNFLQGMFNYSSSVKAVCATEYAIKMWNEVHGPNRPIIVRHLEHSDDYSLIVRVLNRDDFEDFRIMHKLSQRLHGINDSEKKTNCQRFIMEFVSLMCFNGQMAYPNIKKTKEVGINLGGTGFQHDAMNIVSRSSEAVRMGVPIISSYIVQLLQGINIYRKYSLAPKQRNRVTDDPYNMPIEMFGLPDCLPNIYVNTVGDVNNYRLMLYSPKSLKLLKGLYLHSLEKKHDESPLFQDDLIPTFFTPNYVYKRSGRKLKLIRSKLNWSSEQVNECLGENPDFVFIKPRDTRRFKKWLQYMYYNNSFGSAYTTASRQMIMLRLSFFASGKCVQSSVSESLLTIKEYFQELQCIVEAKGEDFREEMQNDFRRVVLNSDPSTQAYYELLDESVIIRTDTPPKAPTAQKLPNSYKFLQLENKMGNILQFLSNPEAYKADRRQDLGSLSVQRDVQKIKTIVNVENLTSKRILNLSKLLKSQSSKTGVALSYSKNRCTTIAEYLVSGIEDGIDYRSAYQLIPKQEFRVIDPFSQQIIYSRDYMYTQNRAAIILENMTMLYYLLRFKYTKSPEEIRDVFKKTTLRENNKSLIEFMHSAELDMKTIDETYHKRMYVFFKSYLCFDDQKLVDFVKNEFVLPFSYPNSLEQRQLKLQSYIGDDFVVFRFKRVDFIGSRLKDDVLVYTQTASLSKCLISILITKRLFNMISQNQFEKAISSKSYERPELIDLSLIKKPVGVKENELTCFKRIGNVYTRSSLSGDSLPVILGCNISNLTKDKKLHMPMDPKVNYEDAIVTNYGHKLFRLPLWPCGNNVCLTLPSVELDDGVNLQVFNNDGLLYSYIHNNEMNLNMDSETAVKLLKGLNVNLKSTVDAGGQGNDSRSIKELMEDFNNRMGLLSNKKIELTEPEEESVPDLENSWVEQMRDEIVLDDQEIDYQDIDEESDGETTVSKKFDAFMVPRYSFIELEPNRTSRNRTQSLVENLPSVTIFLLRSWTGQVVRLWSMDMENAYTLLRISNLVSRKPDLMTPVERLVITYAKWEVDDLMSKGHFEGRSLKIEDVTIRFEDGEFHLSKEYKFTQKERADLTAMHLKGTVTEDAYSKGYIVRIEKGVQEPSVKLIRLPEFKGKFWEVLRDLKTLFCIDGLLDEVEDSQPGDKEENMNIDLSCSSVRLTFDEVNSDDSDIDYSMY